MSDSTTPRCLLLAVDGSEHANAAIRLIKDLPLPANCQIKIISILIPRNAQYHVFLQGVLEKSKAILQEKHPLAIQTELITGYPGEQIVAYAEDHQPDLIVIGARGLRSTIGILLGGVAQQVVEYACCPVLVVRAPYQGLRHILLGTDGSQNSQYALQYLQSCPLPDDVSKCIIHVLPPEITPEIIGQSWQVSMDMAPPVLTEQMQAQILQKETEEEEFGQILLQEALRDLKALGHNATGVIRRGDAATEILAYAREAEIDLIVVGSRGLSTFRSWLLGSVSRKLIHYADCSVLVVKDPKPRR